MSTILDSYYQYEIKEKIIKAIDKAFKNTTEAEPKMVLNLAREIKEQLNSYEASDKISFHIGSIFTHQKPQVINIDENSFWYNKYIEIGDLLLINNLTIIDSQKGEITKRIALLLQAKKISINGSKYMIPDNKKQLDLYANWPKFKYRSSKLNIKDGILIDIKTEHDILNGAKYLLINKNRINSNDLSDSVATATTPNLSGFKPFHCELFDFMTGNAGKEFDFDLNDNGWNNLIKDLIEVISDEKLPPSYRDDVQENRGLFLIASMDGDSLNFGLFGDLYSKYKEENKSNYAENDNEMRGMVIIEINTMINNWEERELVVI